MILIRGQLASPLPACPCRECPMNLCSFAGLQAGSCVFLMPFRAALLDTVKMEADTLVSKADFLLGAQTASCWIPRPIKAYVSDTNGPAVSSCLSGWLLCLPTSVRTAFWMSTRWRRMVQHPAEINTTNVFAVFPWPLGWLLCLPTLVGAAYSELLVF
ncbi:hypothetical protein SK128_002141 [Halocaridina rubra]|uniref:Uncharacterized protein n=1 Tax=Halocaridina rubra TaxID=373956 RepID=A0AAN8ZWX6_HALRR